MIKAIIFDFYGVLYTGNSDVDAELAGYLKKLNNVDLAIISNASISYLRPRLEQTTPLSLFKEIFTSYELNVAKPDPRIFKIALEKLRTQPEETVFIDDKIGHVQSASELGISGIVYKNLKQLNQELADLGVNVGD